MSEEENETQIEQQVRTTVVNIHRAEYDVYIGRKGKGESGTFGNPYDMRNFSRKECLEKFAAYFYERIKNDYDFRMNVLKLRGKRLGCFCKPNDCHGDIIAEYVNEHFDREQVQASKSRKTGSFDVGLREKACKVRDAKLPKEILEQVPEVQMIDGVACGAKTFTAWFEDNKAFITTRITALRTAPEEIALEMRSPQEKDHELYQNKLRNMLEA